MGINRGDVFPSKYISSADVEGREIALTIQSVRIEDVSDGEMKAVVHFDKGTKGMVLNVTNWNVLEDAYGLDTDAWVGHPVVLCVERTTYKGKPTKGLRLHIPQTKLQQKPQRVGGGKRIQHMPPPQDPSGDPAPFEDDIPF